MIEYYYCTECDGLTPALEIYRIVKTAEVDEEGDFFCDYICRTCFDKLHKKVTAIKPRKVLKLIKKGVK